jgi:predicted metalloprotease with PDZ domain
VVISWNQVLLYPSGYTTDELTFQTSVRLPQGWKYGTSLRAAKESTNSIEFQPVSLTNLVDSPLIAGAYFRTIPLAATSPLNQFDMVADSAAALDISPKLSASLKQLVSEAGALLGVYHYLHYDFLFTLSDHVAHFGLEHHQSDDSRVPERTLIDDDLRKVQIGVLPHEFVHSWNAKYRRPADLTTPDYQQPMKDDLLWVYEGLTQYLGNMLGARSGLNSPDEYKESLALTAAALDNRLGRTWRPLADTAIAAQLLYGAPQEWDAWRRGVDFYDEGNLIWLEADTIIREQTQGKRSPDDFCRSFYGGQNTGPMVKTYTFDDVVAAMNEVSAYDWRSFFTARLNSTAAHAPIGGIERSGWRLVYSVAIPGMLRATETSTKVTDVSFSIGLKLAADGAILDAIPGMTAADAGVSPGMKLIAVNGRRWSPEILREALRAAKTSSGPIELLVENADFFKTHRLNYHDGERYPHLERDASKPDRAWRHNMT